jgi:acetolactate decarboxylase
VLGWHLHFVTVDRRGGGHVLACQGKTLQETIQALADVRTAMPGTASFLEAELSQDPSRDLDVARRVGLGADSSR